MAYTRCETCKGRKMVMGLGYMTHKCRTCNGVGHVAVVEDVIVAPDVEPVKRTRRKHDRDIDEREKD